MYAMMLRKEKEQHRIWRRQMRNERRILRTNAKTMLPKILKLKAVLEDQLQQHEIRSIPTCFVKQMEDDLRMLKEKEEAFMQVFMGDFTNVSGMGDDATFNTRMKMQDIQHVLAVVKRSVRAWRRPPSRPPRGAN